MTNTLIITVVSAAFLSALYFLLYCYRPSSLAKIIIKTGSTALLSLVVFVSGVPLLGLALGASSLGDAFLAYDSEKTFMAGVGAFAVAHILYVFLFLQHPLSDFNLLTHGFGMFAAIGVSCLVLGMAFLLWPRAGDLRIPVMIYIPIIAAMGLAALTIDSSIVVAAAALFLLSDTVLALETFVFEEKNAVRRVTPFIVWGTYWPAQLLFLIGFVYSG